MVLHLVVVDNLVNKVFLDDGFVVGSSLYKSFSLVASFRIDKREKKKETYNEQVALLVMELVDMEQIIMVEVMA